MNALLIGGEPACNLGYTYVTAPPYQAVVIGSLTLGELLYFSHPVALEALAAGQPVLLYEPGLPSVKTNRALAAALASKRRELKNWVLFLPTGDSEK